MDLNILISTIITATAALVAIIGGFLVSRVITLAGEKQSIERRLKEIDNDLKIKTEMLENIENIILEEEINDFIIENCEDLITENKTPQELLRENDSFELTEEDLTPHVEKLLSIKEIILESIEKSGQFPDDFDDFVKNSGIKIDTNRTWYEAVYNTLLKIASRNSWNLLLMPPIHSTSNVIEHRDKRRERDRLKNEVQVLTARKIEQEKILNEYGKPTGLWSGLFVLIYSFIVGIAYPSLLLPYPEGTYNDEKTKWLLIILFFSALFAIFAYLVISMYKLTQRK